MFTLILSCCLALSFLLSGMESGVLALSRFRVRRQMRMGIRRAQLLHGYLENPEEFLWTIFVGNTLANLGAFGLIVIALYGRVGGRLGLFILAFSAIVFLFYAFCDLLPKMLFRQAPDRLCLALVVPFRFLHLALSPLVASLTWFSNALLRLTGGERIKGHLFSSRREARLAIQESAQNLTSEERAMVNRVLELQDLTVRSLVVPHHRLVGVTAQTPIAEVLELCRRQPVNRLPVWDSVRPDRRTLGIVSLSSLLYNQALQLTRPALDYAKPPLQLREDVRLEDALRRMQRTRQRMAVVFGFDQREIGVVNLRDILKSIFGEMTL